MKNKSAVPQEILRNVPRSPLSDRAEERIEETYRLLGAQEKPRKSHKRAWISSLSAVAACFLLLFGTNAAFLAFAEGLPIIGAIFRQFSESNRLSQNEKEMAAYLQEHAAPSESGSTATLSPSTVTVFPAGNQEKLLTVSVQDTNYDGNYVFVGFEMEAETDEPILYESTASVSINGEPQLTVTSEGETCEDGFELFHEYDATAYWRKSGAGHYIAQRAFRVPEKFRNEQQLSVAILRGPVSYTVEKGTPDIPQQEDIFLNTSNYTLSFDVKKQPTAQKVIDCTGAEANEIRLENVVTSPVCTEITVAYPAGTSPSVFVQFEDGRRTGYLTNMVRTENDGVTERCTLFAAGLRKNEERKLVVGAYDKSAENYNPAVFLVDLQSCAAAVGTADDLVEYHDVPNWYCGWEKLENFSGTHQITYLNLSQDSMKITIATTDTVERTLKCEVEQAGEVIFSESALRCNFDQECLYREDGEDNVAKSADGLCSYWTSLYGLEGLDTSLPAVIRFYDCDTGELLTEETVTFDTIQ